MLLQVILEGLGLGALLVLICAAGIRKGAVGMVHLYSPAVQQRCVKLGLTSPERIRRNSLLFKAVCIPGYIGYVLVCVYGINGAKGFVQGFWQLLVILSVMNLMDRLLVDGYWVGHTNAWTIPGTEDLKPYITAKDKQKKWLFGTVGMAVIRGTLYQVRHLCADEGTGSVRSDPCFVPSGLHHERSGHCDELCAAVHPCLRRALLRLRVQKERVTDDEEEGNLSFP